MIKTLPFTKITALLLILCLSLSFFACSDDEGGGLFSKPSYVGEWEPLFSSEGGTMTVTEDEVQISYDDVHLTLEYTVSSDEYYTYLECEYQGESVVYVLLNKDMIAICSAPDEDSEWVGTTPNGVKFDAYIRENIVFRVGASTTEPAEKLREQYDIPDRYTIYYYEKADTLYLLDEYGQLEGIFAITTANEIEYAEGITLVNMDPSGRTWIPVNGNFVIIDNK